MIVAATVELPEFLTFRFETDKTVTYGHIEDKRSRTLLHKKRSIGRQHGTGVGNIADMKMESGVGYLE